MATVAKKTYYKVFAALFVLLVATVGVSFVPLPSPFHVLAALLIAGAKAALIVLFFMHVRYASRMTRLIAGAGFFWLVILFFFTFSDYATRAGG